ncbi:MAG: CPBP family intramembrane metalloprotease [Lachnospiraceae bacterium]|nr:CPBP family intramembrane metalloprotease [Lachnospiraceae bacterium]
MVSREIFWSIRWKSEITTSEFEGLGVKAIPAIIVYAIFHTAFPKELLFRGFLLKRLNNKLGFGLANFIQAFIFGLLHGIMLFGIINLIEVILIIAFTGVIGWYMGYINEKKSNGSILPGWMIHAASNLISGICAACL